MFARDIKISEDDVISRDKVRLYDKIDAVIHRIIKNQYPNMEQYKADMIEHAKSTVDFVLEDMIKEFDDVRKGKKKYYMKATEKKGNPYLDSVDFVYDKLFCNIHDYLYHRGIPVDEKGLNFFTDDFTNPERLYEKVEKLVGIVYRKHYQGYSYLKEDLISEGIVKCFRAIEAPHFDSSKSVVNYLYSCVRNEMHNYIYKVTRNGREDVVDGISDNACSYTTYDHLQVIDFETVWNVCELFKRYEFLDLAVCKKLLGLDFKINNFNEEQLECVDFKKRYPIDDVDTWEFVDRVTGIVIHELVKEMGYHGDMAD